MPASASTIIVFAIFAAILAPAAVAMLRPRTGSAAAAFYLLIGATLVYYHTSFATRPLPPALAAIRSAPPNLAPDQCQTLLETAQQGGLFIDMSNPSRAVVRQEAWAQLPAQVQSAIILCLERARPAGSQQAVRIIER